MRDVKVLTAVICVLALLAAPAALLAGPAAPDPLVAQAAQESLSNPLVRKAFEEGQLAPTPTSAIAWKKLQDQRRANLAKAAAVRQRQQMDAGGATTPALAP